VQADGVNIFGPRYLFAIKDTPQLVQIWFGLPGCSMRWDCDMSRSIYRVSPLPMEGWAVPDLGALIVQLNPSVINLHGVTAQARENEALILTLPKILFFY
jgi:hypothetical protein